MLRNYIHALRFWLGQFPRWPGPPSVVIKIDAKTSQAMDEAAAAMKRFGAEAMRQAKER